MWAERACERRRVGLQLAREHGLHGQPRAEERLVHPVAREWIDEPGCIADEERAFGRG